MKPDDGYISYIVNPKSGASSAKALCHDFREYLIRQGYDVRVQYTQSLEHAGELANDAAVDFDCSLAVVSGGDGTVREVAHGLEGSDTPMLIIPCGTENLLASELGFDEKLSTLIRTFEAGYIHHLDLGRINDRCFTSVAGFGFDGDVVERVNRDRNGHIDHFDYFWPIWRSFWEYPFDAMKVLVDGEEIFNGKGLVFVGNISKYAIGLGVLKHADYSDGLLDVCIYRCAGHLHLLKHSLWTIFKLHVRSGDVIYTTGKQISVTSESDAIKSEIDGDPGPSLPAEINVLPSAVKVMMQENAKPAGMRTKLIRAIG